MYNALTGRVLSTLTGGGQMSLILAGPWVCSG